MWPCSMVGMSAFTRNDGLGETITFGYRLVIVILEVVIRDSSSLFLAVQKCLSTTLLEMLTCSRDLVESSATSECARGTSCSSLLR